MCSFSYLRTEFQKNIVGSEFLCRGAIPLLFLSPAVKEEIKLSKCGTMVQTGLLSEYSLV